MSYNSDLAISVVKFYNNPVFFSYRYQQPGNSLASSKKNQVFWRHIKEIQKESGGIFYRLPCHLTNVNSLFRQNVINLQTVTKQGNSILFLPIFAPYHSTLWNLIKFNHHKACISQSMYWSRPSTNQQLEHT